MAISRSVEQRDREVWKASQIGHHSARRWAGLKNEDDLESLNPRTRGGMYRGQMFRPDPPITGKPVVRPNDAPTNRPTTPEEIAAHNARVMAENEKERQRRAGLFFPPDYEPIPKKRTKR